MSDSDLASALEIKNPLHRKKLRLAIEEQRNLNIDGYVCTFQWSVLSMYNLLSVVIKISQCICPKENICVCVLVEEGDAFN